MKKRKGKKRRVVLCFVFTMETITTTKKALIIFEQPLEHANHSDEKVVFAAQTTQQIKDKLERMIKSVGQRCVVTFDSNERIIIAQALRMYVVHLFSTPTSSVRAKELQRCYQLTNYFVAERSTAV